MIDHEPHVSDLRWDQVLAGELSGEQADAAHAHAGSCTRCAARFRELSAEREAFRLRPMPVLGTRPRRSRWWWSAPVGALAAAAVIVALLQRRDNEGGERVKGGAVKLLLEAGRPGALLPVATNDVIHGGDYLQAGYTANRDGFGAVLAIDGVGAANAYVPSRGDAMVALPAGVERSYPESTVLDAVVGPELVVIVWCETAHPVKPMLDELRIARRIRTPGDCTVREVTLDKRGPR